MLDSELKPVLLEVNHAPSFATDSPLDFDIKKSLFVDMFKMLGLSIEKKQEKLTSVYEEKLMRMTQKLSLNKKTKIKEKKL
jgi:tubulin polyglutamylase TTLL6/13